MSERGISLKTCSYCGTELNTTTSPIICPFCLKQYHDEQELGAYGERTRKRVFTEYVTHEMINQSVYELDKLHTLDLMIALRLCREERTQLYNLIRLLNKTMDEDSSSSEMLADGMKDAGEMYIDWTRKMWVIENLLVDRLGYYPSRISDDMLIRVKENSLKTMNKRMTISKERRKQKKEVEI